MQPPPVRLLLVDDHGILLKPLRVLLSSHLNVEVVGECADGREAVASARSLQPDVILMDLNMPGLNGIEATRAITRDVAHARVIIVSSYADQDLVYRSLRAGARGYIIKRSDIDELILAIRTVMRGNTYFSAALASTMDLHELAFKARQPDPQSPREGLTTREREVLQLLAEGHSSRAIGEILSISARTVESHKARMMPKIGAHNRADLFRFALQNGMTSIVASAESGDVGNPEIVFDTWNAQQGEESATA